MFIGQIWAIYNKYLKTNGWKTQESPELELTYSDGTLYKEVSNDCLFNTFWAMLYQ